MGTHAAMTANYRFFCLFIEIYCVYNTGVFAFTATDAFYFIQKYAAAGTLSQSVAGTHFHTCRLIATKTHYGNETAGHAPCCTNSDRAFDKGMVFLINNRTDAHTGETAQAFPHFPWLKYFRHCSSIDNAIDIFYYRT
jgi:hypothetical protein